MWAKNDNYIALKSINISRATKLMGIEEFLEATNESFQAFHASKLCVKVISTMACIDILENSQNIS